MPKTREEFNQGIEDRMEKITSPEDKVKFLMDLAFQKDSLRELLGEKSFAKSEKESGQKIRR